MALPANTHGGRWPTHGGHRPRTADADQHTADIATHGSRRTSAFLSTRRTPAFLSTWRTSAFLGTCLTSAFLAHGGRRPSWHTADVGLPGTRRTPSARTADGCQQHAADVALSPRVHVLRAVARAVLLCYRRRASPGHVQGVVLSLPLVAATGERHGRVLVTAGMCRQHVSWSP